MAGVENLPVIQEWGVEGVYTIGHVVAHECEIIHE